MKKNILLSAYSCEPGFSSEREIGWKWSNLLSKTNNVFLITRQSNKDTIESFINQKELICNIEFFYYDLPQWAKFWKKGEKGLYLYYTLWQLGALFKMKKIIKSNNIDIVHYITFGSLLLPHFTAFLNTKFLLGPIGGAENVPLKFIKYFNFRGKISEIVRHVFQVSQKINPLFLFTCYRANKILVRTRESERFIPSIFKSKVELMLETGAPEELLDYSISTKKNENKIRIITVGRFINSKINILTFKIIKEFKQKFGDNFEFIVVGDGASKNQLMNFCIDNDIHKQVTFTGWIDRENVFEYLSNSDIYFSTTFKEGGTWAFFEAVALELPVVCTKISGPDMIVGDNCGFKIEPDNTKNYIINMSESLYRLSINKALRMKFSSSAKKYLMDNLTWDIMMLRINEIYKAI